MRLNIMQTANSRQHSRFTTRESILFYSIYQPISRHRSISKFSPLFRPSLPAVSPRAPSSLGRHRYCPPHLRREQDRQGYNRIKYSQSMSRTVGSDGVMLVSISIPSFSTINTTSTCASTRSLTSSV